MQQGHNSKVQSNAQANAQLFVGYIDQLVRETGLEPEEAMSLIEMFTPHGRQIVNEIADSCQKGDFLHCQLLAHQLKGAAGNLRILSVQQMALSLENAAKGEELALLKKALYELQGLFDETT